jgi:dihydroxyacetone kinase-like protein
MIEKLEKAFSWENGEKFAVMVNGLGGTPLMEQYIFYQDVRKHLDRELDVVFSKVGNFMTAIDMAGISLTLLKLEPEWVAYLTEPVAHTAW